MEATGPPPEGAHALEKQHLSPESAAPGASPQERRGDAAERLVGDLQPATSLPRWFWPALLLLIGFAYRGLAGYQPEAKLYDIRGAERWFFVVSETSPYLIYVVFGWFLLMRRHALERALVAGRSGSHASGPAAMGTAGVLLSAALALYLWAYHVGALDLLIPSFAFTLLGGVTLLGGHRALRCLLFPCAFLVFAIPLPAVLVNLLVFPLQLATAQLAAGMLDLIGMEVVVFGDFIITPRELFHVIETCSGLRGIETLVMASVLYVDLVYRNRLHAALIVLTAPALAFLVNGLRVVTIVMNPLSETVAIHTLQGMVVLVLGVLSLVAVDRLLVRLPYLARRAPRRPLPEPEEATARRARIFDGRAAGLAGVLGLLAFAPLWLPLWHAPERDVPRLSQLLPPVLGDWQAKRGGLEPGYLGTVRFDEYAVRRYQAAERAGDLETEVTLFTARHRRLDRRGSLISQKTAYPGVGARLLSRKPARIGGRYDGELLIFRTALGRRAVYHWYEGVDSLGEEVARSFFALDRSFPRRSGEARMHRLSTPFRRGARDREEAIERLDQITEELLKTPLFAQKS